MSLDIGHRLGPYEVLARIGEGGMGEVYKARDTRLDRIVAIKTLKTGEASRFEREARAIAALNHPNICTLFDVGADYLVMEFVDGKPAHGPLPLADALRVAIQIAAALEAAHGAGILHRDLKPANILMTAASIKLLDFGLAKIAEAQASDATTLEGSIVGTAGYMSPEQVRSQPLDARSDIFSFGAVLYELISGRRAFQGASLLDTLSGVLYLEPAPLASPAAPIIVRCLAKDQAQRYQSITEVRSALEALQHRPAQAEHSGPSIAVLPFANMSSDKENEYFSDGIAEEILNTLAQIRGLKVIARTSSFAFRGKEQDITAIAGVLHVKTVLEGSVRRAGNRIRVTAQLIDGSSGAHVWSERYDRELEDVFAVQDEIAQAIGERVREQLGPGELQPRHHRPSIAAYDLYLRGLHQMAKLSPESIARARELFLQAAAEDDQYIEPRLALVATEIHLLIEGGKPAALAVQSARNELRKVLAIDDGNAQANHWLGVITAIYDYDWPESARLFRRAIAASPDDHLLEARFGQFYLFPVEGRLRETTEAAAKLVAQDPLNVFARGVWCTYLNWSGEFERAEQEAQAALGIEDHWWVRQALAEGYTFRGLVEKALQQARAAVQMAPWNPRAMALLAGLLTISGHEDEAEPIRQKLETLPPWAMFVYSITVGNVDEAARWFRQSVEQREPYVVISGRSPRFRLLHESPHWPALAQMMNLPAHPVEPTRSLKARSTR